MKIGGNNFEDSFLGNLDVSLKRKRDNVLEDNERLEKIKQKMINGAIFDRPDISKYTDVYSKNEIEKDKEELARLENIFESTETPEIKKTKLIADLFEGIIISESEKSEWLGENAIIHAASKFDDYKHKVDAICEFTQDNNESSRFLALGIDVTFGSSNSGSVDKKFATIMQEIKRNSLAEVKYFSDNSGKHRELKLPRVIAGASAGTVKELLELWDKGDKKALAKHPYQCALLISLRQQCAYFYKYAKRCGSEEIASKYEEAVNIFNEIIDPKVEFLESLQEEAFKDEVIKKIWEKVGDLN